MAREICIVASLDTEYDGTYHSNEGKGPSRGRGIHALFLMPSFQRKVYHHCRPVKGTRYGTAVGRKVGSVDRNLGCRFKVDLVKSCEHAPLADLDVPTIFPVLNLFRRTDKKKGLLPNRKQKGEAKKEKERKNNNKEGERHNEIII